MGALDGNVGHLKALRDPKVDLNDHGGRRWSRRRWEIIVMVIHLHRVEVCPNELQSSA